MSSIRKNVLTASASSVLNHLSYVVFVLILAKKYPVIELSYYYLSFNIYFLVSLFASLGIGNLVIREYFKSEDKGKFLGNLFALELVASATAYGLMLIVIWVAEYPPVVLHYLLVIGVMLFFDNVNFVLTNVFVSIREQQFSGIAASTEAGLKLLLGLSVLVAFESMSLFEIAAILVLLRLVYCVVHLGMLVRYQRSVTLADLVPLQGLDKSLVRCLVQEGKTFFAISLLVAAYTRIPIIMLPKLSSLEDVAFFDLALKAFTIATLLPNILVSTFYNTILKNVNAFDMLSEKLSEYLNVFVPLGNGLIVVALLVVPIGFSLLFGGKFDNSVRDFQFIVLSLTMLGVINTQANVMFAHGMEKIDLYLNIGMFALVMVLVSLSVPMLGSLGIALAFLASRLCFFLVQGKILRKLFPTLTVRNQMVDTIGFPVMMALLFLLDEIPFVRPLRYAVMIAYLFALPIRYRRPLFDTAWRKLVRA